MSVLTRLCNFADELASLLKRNIGACVCCRRLGQPCGSALFAGPHSRRLHADLDTHLAGKPSAQEDILPTLDTWLQQVRNWGLRHDEQVVLYDDAGG